jgi:L,D-transpeptidase ErfK/SrfK
MDCTRSMALWSAGLLAVACVAAHAEMFQVPPAGVDLIGLEESTVAQVEDTLPDIARRYGLGYEEIALANPSTDPWLPGQGTPISLPTQHILPPGAREGIVINLADHRLYYFLRKTGKQPAELISHPISVGQMDWRTPIGVTQIVAKIKKPTWYPPASIRKQHEDDGDPIPAAVPPGPDNPLGDYAMRLGIPGGAYLIHGTNKPVGVGMQVTHGCIRMYPEDIESLFRMVNVGTQVRIINQPVKTGWNGGVLYLEVHPPLQNSGSVPIDLTELTRILVAATQERPVRINWPLAERTLVEARGVPTAISQPQVGADKRAMSASE